MESAATRNLRPEKQLLLCCARTPRDSSIAAKIKTLAGQNLDWPYLLAIAEDHGVIPLLYSQLDACGRSEVPKQVMEKLRGRFQHNARRNLFLTSELFRILDAFDAGGISLIPYKGPVLAEQAYGNLAYRQFVDLDIVVRQCDVGRAVPTIVSLGYRTDASVSAAGAQVTSRIPGQYIFVHENSTATLELHTERTMRYFPRPLDLEALSRRLEAVSMCGRDVRTFSIEDALSMLCVHASKHFWERIAWIADIAQLAQTSRGVNWDAAINQACVLGAERMLYLGLLLSRNLLGADLPREVCRRLENDGGVQALASTVHQGLSRDDGTELGIAQRCVFRIRMRGDFWAGMRYLFRLATAPTEEDWNQLQLKGPISALYRAFRPLRLLRKYGTGWTRTAHRPPDNLNL